MANSTFEDFKRDWTDFRQKLGEKSFWDLPPEKREEWFAKLGQVYFMLEPLNKEDQKIAENMFLSISDEYARRASLILSLQLKKLLQ